MTLYPGGPTPLSIADWTVAEINALAALHKERQAAQ